MREFSIFKRLFPLLIFLMFSTIVFSQNEDRNWCFHDSSRLFFPLNNLNEEIYTDVNISRFTNNNSWNYPNSISVSDSDGLLLFYSDGKKVWNKNNDIMDGGEFISNSGNPTPFIYVVKKPNSSQYYIIEGKYCQRIVDISENDGLGKVIKIDSLFMGIPLVNHPSKRFVWMYEINSNNNSNYKFYKFFATGKVEYSHNINIPDTTNEGGRNNRFLHISPDGKTAVTARRTISEFDTNTNGGIVRKENTGLPYVFIMNFDIENASLSNFNKINISPKNILTNFSYNNYFALFEFSVTSKFLYLSFNGYDHENLVGLYQCPTNLQSDTLLEKFCHKISANKNEEDYNAYSITDMKRAPNNKIYLTKSNYSSIPSNITSTDSTLSVINFPELPKSLIEFNEYSIKLPSRSPQLFPRFLPSLYYPEIKSKLSCVKDSVLFWMNYANYDSIFWQFGDGTYFTSDEDTIYHQFTNAGLFEVKAKIYKNGLIDTSIFWKEIYNIPKLDLGNDTLICEGSTLIINAFNSQYHQYKWNNDSTSSQINVIKNGKYKLIVSTPFCKTSDSLFVGFLKCGIISNNICQTDTLKASVYENNADSIQWDFGDGTIKLGNKSEVHYYNNSGTYNLRALIYYKGLSIEFEKKVEVFESPNNSKFIISNNKGCEPLSVEFNLNHNLSESFNYLINTDALISYMGTEDLTKIAFTYDIPGVYMPKATIETLNGCKVEMETDSVWVYPRPNAAFNYTPEEPDMDNMNLKFNNLSTDATNFAWSIQSLGEFTELEPEVKFEDTGYFSIMLVAISENDCKDTAFGGVYIRPLYRVFFPNAFSPNNDGMNEKYFPVFRGVESFYFSIYNIWGEKIFETQSNQAWDGLYKGVPVPVGVYTYLAEVISITGEKQFFSGTITLMR